MSTIPTNYICKGCGMKGDHWIMSCNQLRIPGSDETNDDLA